MHTVLGKPHARPPVAAVLSSDSRVQDRRVAGRPDDEARGGWTRLKQEGHHITATATSMARTYKAAVIGCSRMGAYIE